MRRSERSSSARRRRNHAKTKAGLEEAASTAVEAAAVRVIRGAEKYKKSAKMLAVDD